MQDRFESMKVTYIDHMGSDLDVVNAARVSFDKESSMENDAFGNQVISSGDEKLIKYLAQHNHWSPFAHCFIKFRIKAPIFVCRQLDKHQVGLSHNEISRRYVDTVPTLYYPESWRKKAQNKKQGSSDETVERLSVGNNLDVSIFEILLPTLDESVNLYEKLIENDIAPEQARMILPQNMMTEFIWSGSLYAFSRICKLRLDKEHAQKETSIIAEDISKKAIELFPISWKYLLND